MFISVHFCAYGDYSLRYRCSTYFGPVVWLVIWTLLLIKEQAILFGSSMATVESFYLFKLYIFCIFILLGCVRFLFVLSSIYTRTSFTRPLLLRYGSGPAT